jgi:3-methyladenine DNA glycosylase AlkD
VSPKARPTLLAALRERLAREGEPERAAGQQRYMKSAMPYHGVANPGVRRICAELFADYPFADLVGDPGRWRDDVRQLWHGATHREERYGALMLCAHRDARPLQGLPKTARARPPIDAVARGAAALELYEELIVSGAWWDLVDEIATHRLSALLARHRFVADHYRRWSTSDDLWLRRAAVIGQVGLGAETDTALLFEVIEVNVSDKSFWLRKAIGWALRQYARTDPEWVKSTVRTLRSRLSPLSRREALKHLGTTGIG